MLTGLLIYLVAIATQQLNQLAVYIDAASLPA